MFGIDSLKDVVDIASRLATAYATGGMSEIMRLAQDVGVQVIDRVLSEMNVQLPEEVRTALESYVSGYNLSDLA